MLLPDELKRYGFQRRLKRIEQIWLDYVQDHTLALLYLKYPDLVFRGGTCIWKLHGGERFSEDLDLARREVPDNLPDYLVKEFELLGFTVDLKKERETRNMYFLRLGVERPDTTATTNLSIEILRNAEPEDWIEEKDIHSPYPDVPRIDVQALTRNAILTEKITAVCERNRPRDVHDVYTLLKAGATAGREEIVEECRDFTIEDLRRSLEEKKDEWKGLESLVVGDLPSFEEEKDYILQRLRTELDGE